MKRASLLLSAAASLAGAVPAQSPDVVPGQVVVKVRPGALAEFAAAAAERTGPAVGPPLAPEELVRPAFRAVSPRKSNRVGVDRIQVVAVPAGREAELAAELARLPSVEWAETNDLSGGLTGGPLLPNDPSFGIQWALDQPNDIDMDVPDAWALRGTTETGGDLVVAVVDTGYDIWSNQADWEGVVWKNPLEVRDGIDNDSNGLVDDVNGWDYDEDDWIPQAVNSHGVNTGGIIAALTDNGEQVAGVASGVKVMVLKTFNGAGSFPTSGPYAGELSVATALIYAADQGAHLANNSWYNGESPSALINDSVDYALENGVHLIFSAANNGTDVAWPGQHPGVVAVAAIDENGMRSQWGFQSSNYGAWVDVSAGGTNIATTANLGGVTPDFAGTSAAAPLVTGLAALLLAEDGDLSTADVREVLMDGATDIDALNPGFEGLLGAGHVNALASLELLEGHQDLGGGLPGTTDPVLNSWGRTEAGETVTVSVHDAPPSAPGVLVFGFSQADVALLGGVLVPSPDVVMPVVTGPDGAVHFETTLGAPLPGGPAVWEQALLVDAGAPEGVAFTNAQVISGP